VSLLLCLLHFLVNNARDVELLLMHNGSYAAEIAHGVSSRKRIEIVEKARVVSWCRAGSDLKGSESPRVETEGRGRAVQASFGGTDGSLSPWLRFSLALWTSLPRRGDDERLADEPFLCQLNVKLTNGNAKVRTEEA